PTAGLVAGTGAMSRSGLGSAISNLSGLLVRSAVRNRPRCSAMLSGCRPAIRGYLPGMPAPLGEWQPAQAGTPREAIPPRQIDRPRSMVASLLAEAAASGLSGCIDR